MWTWLRASGYTEEVCDPPIAFFIMLYLTRLGTARMAVEDNKDYPTAQGS